MSEESDGFDVVYMTPSVFEFPRWWKVESYENGSNLAWLAPLNGDFEVMGETVLVPRSAITTMLDVTERIYPTLTEREMEKWEPVSMESGPEVYAIRNNNGDISWLYVKGQEGWKRISLYLGVVEEESTKDIEWIIRANEGFFMAEVDASE